MTASSERMVTALVQLHESLVAAPLPLSLPATAAQVADRSDIIGQLDDYVLPRLMAVEAPLLAVVGGSTGAGKSTLVNSLVGERISEPGILRPTTRSPVLVHNPADAEWFTDTRVLPDLPRSSAGAVGVLQLAASTAIPPGVALLDAPDIDSVEAANRELASELLAAADLWLFVTSAARYADQVPWEYLAQAAERSAAVAIVLDRVDESAANEVRGHLARMLSANGLKDSPLFVVYERELDGDGLLPSADVREIRTWLSQLAADAAARTDVVRQTLEGAIRTLVTRSHAVAEAVEAQQEAAAALRQASDAPYDEALAAINQACADGTLMRGEVLARWQEFVGAGELLQALESRMSRLRDRVTSAFKGHQENANRVSVAVESGLLALLLDHAETAAAEAERAWRELPGGSQLLAGSEDLSRASREFRGRAEAMIRDWQNGVFDLVKAEGADRRSTARMLALGVNGTAVALMVVVFASTGGITGAEVGVAGGAAVVGQKVLEAIFGDQAVRRLTDLARQDLARRVADLSASERVRFSTLVDALGLTDADAGQIRKAARQVDDLRFAGRVI